jgi:hypothetical protein
LPWKGHKTTFGLFQQAYQGSPAYSYIDLGYMFGNEVSQATAVFGRDKWVNMTQDPTTGAITLGNPYTKRTPWFTQSDFNISQEFRTGEHQSIGFSAYFFNLLNQRAVTSYYGGMNTTNSATPVEANGSGLVNASSYQAYETGYNLQQWINDTSLGQAAVTKNSWYGMPFTYQLPRSMRFGVSYTF